MAQALEGEKFYDVPGTATKAAILAQATAGTLSQYKWYIARDTHEIFWAKTPSLLYTLTNTIISSYTTKYSVLTAVGLNNPVTVTHNLGTTGVAVTVIDNTGAIVYPTIKITGINTITVTAAGPIKNVTVVVLTGFGVASGSPVIKYSGSANIGLNNPTIVLHSMNTTDVIVSVANATGEIVLPTVRIIDANNISITANGAIQTVAVTVLTGVL
jgi:hypothetical protein